MGWVEWCRRRRINNSSSYVFPWLNFGTNIYAVHLLWQSYPIYCVRTQIWRIDISLHFDITKYTGNRDTNVFHGDVIMIVAPLQWRHTCVKGTKSQETGFYSLFYRGQQLQALKYCSIVLTHAIKIWCQREPWPTKRFWWRSKSASLRDLDSKKI